MPRKTCKFRLSRNSTKFDVLARFRERIPIVKSISSSDLENKFQIFNRNYNFVTEITILPFFQKLEFLGSYPISPMKLQFYPNFPLKIQIPQPQEILHQHQQKNLLLGKSRITFSRVGSSELSLKKSLDLSSV